MNNFQYSPISFFFIKTENRQKILRLPNLITIISTVTDNSAQWIPLLPLNRIPDGISGGKGRLDVPEPRKRMGAISRDCSSDEQYFLRQ